MAELGQKVLQKFSNWARRNCKMSRGLEPTLRLLRISIAPLPKTFLISPLRETNFFLQTDKFDFAPKVNKIIELVQSTLSNNRTERQYETPVKYEN